MCFKTNPKGGNICTSFKSNKTNYKFTSLRVGPQMAHGTPKNVTFCARGKRKVLSAHHRAMTTCLRRDPGMYKRLRGENKLQLVVSALCATFFGVQCAICRLTHKKRTTHQLAQILPILQITRLQTRHMLTMLVHSY